MASDLDRSIANEMPLLEALGQAFDEEAEDGPAPWRTEQIAKLNALLDEIRKEREAPGG